MSGETCELCGEDAAVPETCDNDGRDGYRCEHCNGWYSADEAEVIQTLRKELKEYKRCYNLRDAVADKACKARDDNMTRAHVAELRVAKLERVLRDAKDDFASIQNFLPTVDRAKITNFAKEAEHRVKVELGEAAAPTDDPEILP